MNTDVYYLHCYSFKNGIFLNSLDVIDSKTNQEVHDDDGHYNDKDNKERLGSVHVRNCRDSMVVLVVKEQVIILHLSSCHDESFNH